MAAGGTSRARVERLIFIFLFIVVVVRAPPQALTTLTHLSHRSLQLTLTVS
jgi:hypothetical protein